MIDLLELGIISPESLLDAVQQWLLNFGGTHLARFSIFLRRGEYTCCSAQSTKFQYDRTNMECNNEVSWILCFLKSHGFPTRAIKADFPSFPLQTSNLVCGVYSPLYRLTSFGTPRARQRSTATVFFFSLSCEMWRSPEIPTHGRCR